MTDCTLLDEKIAIGSFSTKAETLQFLQSCLKNATVLPLLFFTLKEWRHAASDVLNKIQAEPWTDQKLVVRSSALSEDQANASLAGAFTSVMNVHGEKQLFHAIETVIESYPDDKPSNQILIQPFLENVAVAGVAFSYDPNTQGPYIIINYDDTTGSTQSITSGHAQESKCFVWHKAASTKPVGFLAKVITLIKELEEIFQSRFIDIEFALTQDNTLYLFQARPLVIKAAALHHEIDHQPIIARIAQKVALGHKRHPYLYGNYTVYGVMPDWNPAEIIGVRPRPLALSLYRNLVTDSVWAYQRDNYGYNNLRSFPLLVDFEGLPYIDVRVSFNSFLPKELPEALSEKLVNYYIDRLMQSPALHDKIEFEIVFSCYTLDLTERLQVLSDYGFTPAEQQTIATALTQLTNGIIHNKQGLWRKDLQKIQELARRQPLIFTSDLDPVSKMYWILEDCKRYGTLPFAGLARAGFIAIQLLKSFVAKKIIDETSYAHFFLSLNTISSEISRDFCEQSKQDFLAKYGHLRPGTYDILSLRYDEAPDIYFDWENKKAVPPTAEKNFSLTLTQLRDIQAAIDADGLDSNVLELLEFIKIAIESREYAKFVFTRSVSHFLQILADYAQGLGFSREDCSYISMNIIPLLYETSMDPKEIIANSIRAGKDSFATVNTISLPPLLCHPQDAWSFHFPETEPNFITQKKCMGKPVALTGSKHFLDSNILFIPNADPGFDWIFSHNLAGFITQFGGVNSHMAIRASELGIPAVIGVGETRYHQWRKANQLMIDAANKQVIAL